MKVSNTSGTSPLKGNLLFEITCAQRHLRLRNLKREEISWEIRIICEGHLVIDTVLAGLAASSWDGLTPCMFFMSI